MKSPNQIFYHFQDQELDESMLDHDPYVQARAWLKQAEDQGHLIFPNAMTLSTLSEDGFPASRIVLLKDIEASSLVFYTNYHSPKSLDILGHPQIALQLYWPIIERQIRIVGTAEKATRPESEAYFATRERESQIGAWASDQGKPVASRAELERIFSEYENEFEGKAVPCPPHWGGFRVFPASFEFWQLRPARYHDRFKYLPGENGKWNIVRLFP